MVFSDDVGIVFNPLLQFYGDVVRFRYFNGSWTGAGSYYDDDLVLTQSGTDFYCSGMFQPVLSRTMGKTGGIESQMFEEGRILTNDSILYVNGSVLTSGLFRVGIGSPPTREFSIIPFGVFPSPAVNGSIIYKKLYLRTLPNGSFVGE